MRYLLWLFWALLLGGVGFWLVNLFLAMRDIDRQYEEDWKCFRLDEEDR